MARVLISSIGTGNREKGYAKANYNIQGKTYENEEFIAKVLCAHLKIDRLYLVGTSQSIWEVVYKNFGGDDENELKIYESKENGELEKYLPNIEQIIDKKLGTNGSKCFIIKYGVNDNELWENFDIFLQIAKKFSPDDEIYLDITHSFRSLSLMSFVMSEFISNSKDKELDIRGVYYGMFEYAGQNNDVTPIIDLGVFFELLKWSKAIKEFKKYGNAREFLELLGGVEVETNAFNRFKNFTQALSMADIVALQNSVKGLKTQLAFFENNENQIFRLISKDLREFTEIFEPKSIALVQYRLAKWYLESQNYPMVYMLLSEAVVSAVKEKNGLSDSEEAKGIIRDNTKNNTAYEIWRYKIVPIRNNIAHVVELENRSKNPNPENSIENLPKYINELKPIFKGLC